MIIDFLKDRHVPKLLSHRIQEFYHYVAMKEVRRDERDIITELPAKLRSKVGVLRYYNAQLRGCTIRAYGHTAVLMPTHSQRPLNEQCHACQGCHGSNQQRHESCFT
jgi:hypothetical protein